MYRLLKVVTEYPDGATKSEIIEGHAKLDVILSTLAGCISSTKMVEDINHPFGISHSDKYEIQQCEGNIVTVIAKLKFDHK